MDNRSRSLIVRGTGKDLQMAADLVAVLDLSVGKAQGGKAGRCLSPNQAPARVFSLPCEDHPSLGRLSCTIELSAVKEFCRFRPRSWRETVHLISAAHGDGSGGRVRRTRFVDAAGNRPKGGGGASADSGIRGGGAAGAGSAGANPAAPGSGAAPTPTALPLTVQLVSVAVP
jgi:hypothetical protein